MMSLKEAARLRGLAKADKDLRARERKEAKAQWEREEPMRNLLLKHCLTLELR